MQQFLSEAIQSRVTGQGWQWFQTALRAALHPVPEDRLLAYYTAASRKLGRQALALTDREKEQLQTLDPVLPLDYWGVDEAGRVVLLLSLPDYDGFEDLVLRCYRLGDSREQQSWLRGLSLLSGCKSFLETAIDACRTNMLPLFEAIACENPYPSLYFPELNFNQMVLKSLFLGVALSRIMGVESRFNPELSRMADDYVTEREAAGRSVPADIWLVLAPRIPAEGLPRVYRYLQHEDLEHRHWAAVGLGYVYNEGARTALERQLEVESDPRVAAAIKHSLERIRL
ncbi:MAG: EboA domain-containing protein [Acidobacteriota bacterium]